MLSMWSDFQSCCRMENKNSFFIQPPGALKASRSVFAAAGGSLGCILLGLVRLVFRKKGSVSWGSYSPG